jgi:hypothetical protein
MVTNEESNFDYYATHDNEIPLSFSMNQFISDSNERSKSNSLSNSSNDSLKEELDEPITIINGILPYYKKDGYHYEEGVIHVMKRIRFNIFLLMTASFFAGYRFRCFVENRRT